jgi:hypothetical protein
LGGREFEIRREGMNGDRAALEGRRKELDADPKVAALSLGGADLFLNAAGRTYWFREMKPLARLVQNKALVDGSGLKGAFEADTVRFMREDLGLELAGKTALITSAVDRWGLAMALIDADVNCKFGDLLYILDIPKVIHSVTGLRRVVRSVAPLAIQLPFAWLYPSEADHTTEPKRSAMTDALYHEVDIIVGDYKYVIEHIPDDLEGTWVITNTTTAADVDFLRSRGVSKLITTTPRMEGRSFGTNALEALLVAAAGEKSALSPEQYLKIMAENNLSPSVQDL